MTKKGWTDEEIQFLKDNYLHMTQKQIGAALNKSVSYVNHQAKKINLSKMKILREYREDYIKEHYAFKDTQDIANELGISRDTVYKILSRLGEDRPVKPKRRQYDDNMIYGLYKGETLLAEGNVKEIAEHIGTSVQNVKFYNSNVNRKRETGGNRRMLVFLYDENEVD